MAPPYRAELVGSLLRPHSILDARRQTGAGLMHADQLRALEDEEIRKAVAMQEELGFRVATDGEFRRESWNRDFLLKLANVTLAKSHIAVGASVGNMQTAPREPTAMAVTGKLTRPAPIFLDAFKFLQSVTHVTAKLTIPSPTILHFRGGRDAIDRKAYPDLQEFYADAAKAVRAEIADLAAAGCTYLQIDDVNFAYLCDPGVAEQVRAMGEDPDALPFTYAKLINASIAGHDEAMTIGLHMCRGNAQTGSTAGGYDRVAETVFNEIAVKCFFLEFDDPRSGGFDPLRFLPKDKSAVLGLISSKTAPLESRDMLMRRLDEAAKIVPLERLAISTQCGFSSGAESTLRKGMSEAEQRAKLQLVVDVARDAWGTT